MQFEWDEAKNFENIHKHQTNFADVPEVFESAITDLVAILGDGSEYVFVIQSYNGIVN